MQLEEVSTGAQIFFLMCVVVSVINVFALKVGSQRSLRCTPYQWCARTVLSISLLQILVTSYNFNVLSNGSCLLWFVLFQERVILILFVFSHIFFFCHEICFLFAHFPEEVYSSCAMK